MEWTAYADEVRELLGLEGNPVAITYSMKPPSTSVGGKHRYVMRFYALGMVRLSILQFLHPAVLAGLGTWVLANVQEERETRLSRSFLLMGKNSTAP